MRFMFLIFILLLSFHALAEESEVNEEDSTLFKVRMYENPKRDISVIVTKEGFYPANISVFQGEKVKFYVTSTNSEAACFLISGHDVYLSAYKGNLTEAEVHFKQSGTFDYYCPSMKHRGSITVIKKRNPERKIASKNKATKKTEWTPRD